MANLGEVIQRLYKDYKQQRSNNYYIYNGLGWNINYTFQLDKGETKYLAFETGDELIHATNRRTKFIALDNQYLDCRVTTLKEATIDTLGADITDDVLFNADLNSDNGINLTVYDETTTVSDEGQEAPFSSRIKADRRQASQEFITDQYILKKDGIRVLKFENLGEGDVEVEYASTGYQEAGDER